MIQENKTVIFILVLAVLAGLLVNFVNNQIPNRQGRLAGGVNEIIHEPK
jgi:hypothetical protein